MRAILAFILLVLTCLAQAQMYRWTDETGKVHYTDTPPPAKAKNVEKKNFSSGQGGEGPLPYALQDAVKNFPVTLYTADDCKEYCAQARALLDKRGVPYKEIPVSDAKGIAELKRLSGGNSVPVMSVGRAVQNGFESSAYNAALDNAGYPRTSLLPPGKQVRQLVKPAPVAEVQAAPPAIPQLQPAENTPK
jgi:glutaredoxin